MDPWTIGLSAAGVLGNLFGNSQAEADARRNFDLQKSMIDRQNMLFDTIFKLAKEHNWDPSALIDAATAKAKTVYGIDSGNAAANARVLGYGPGDTVPLDQINSIRSNEQANFQQWVANTQRQAFLDELNAYSAANPGSLNAGIAAAGNNAQAAIGREQGLGNMLSTLAQTVAAAGAKKPSAPLQASQPMPALPKTTTPTYGGSVGHSFTLPTLEPLSSQPATSLPLTNPFIPPPIFGKRRPQDLGFAS